MVGKRSLQYPKMKRNVIGRMYSMEAIEIKMSITLNHISYIYEIFNSLTTIILIHI